MLFDPTTKVTQGDPQPDPLEHDFSNDDDGMFPPSPSLKGDELHVFLLDQKVYPG